MNNLFSIGISLLYITSTYVIGLDKIDYLSAKDFQFLLYRNLTIYTTTTVSSSLLQNLLRRLYSAAYRNRILRTF